MCDKYDLLVLEVNCGEGDAKADFQSYITKTSAKYPCVWQGAGGLALDDALGNGGSGNPKYLIFPNKTFRNFSSLPTTIRRHVHVNVINPGVFSLPKAEKYSVTAFNAQGRVLGTYSVRTMAQVYQIHNKLPAGVRIFQVRAEGSSVVETMKLAR